MRSLCVPLLFIYTSLLLGKPSQPSVVHGSVSIGPSNGPMILQASTDRSIVHWKDFSIDLGEQVQFQLPSQTSAILNRVTGRSPSLIHGLLQSNGRVYLINPHGIVISPEGVIDTAGFVASTLQLTDKNFLENNFLFEGSSTQGIAIHGQVIASNGDAIFIGYSIDKTGSVQTPQGTAAFGVGQRVVVHPVGEERLAIIPTDSPPAETGLSHAGPILAHHVELKADGNVYALAINDTGAIRATKLEEQAGRIILKAVDGFAATSGHLAAEGGEIQVLGKNAYVNGTLDVSSPEGGGTIYVGGERSETAFVDKAAVLAADATGKGRGGHVSVFSEEAYVHGSVAARGGPHGGAGGEIDIAGVKITDILGQLDNSAPKGLEDAAVHIDTPPLLSPIPFLSLPLGAAPTPLPEGFFYLIAFYSAEMSNNLKLFDTYVWLDPFSLCLQGKKTKTIQSSFDFDNCQEQPVTIKKINYYQADRNDY